MQDFPVTLRHSGGEMFEKSIYGPWREVFWFKWEMLKKEEGRDQLSINWPLGVFLSAKQAAVLQNLPEKKLGIVDTQRLTIGDRELHVIVTVLGGVAGILMF